MNIEWREKLERLRPMQWGVLVLAIFNFILFIVPKGIDQTNIDVWNDDAALIEILEKSFSPIEVSSTPQESINYDADNHNETSNTTHNTSHDAAVSNSSHEAKVEHSIAKDQISPDGHQLITDSHQQPNEHGVSIAEDRLPSVEQSSHSMMHQVEKRNNLSGKVCYEVGPLKSDEQQKQVESALAEKGMFVSIKFDQMHAPLGYWVFIPPQRSLALGRLKVEELKLKGFKDVILLVDNEPKYAVSLGLFQEQANANKRLLKAQSFGFNAKMDIRYLDEQQLWLLVETDSNRDLTESQWSELLQTFNQVELKSVNCH